MDQEESHIIKQIVEIQKNIRKKSRAIKLDRSEEDSALKKFYKPIIEPILNINNTISKTSKKNINTENEYKQEQQLEPVLDKDDENEEISYSTETELPVTPDADEYETYDDFETSKQYFQTLIDKDERKKAFDKYHPRLKFYIQDMIQNGFGEYDTTYGVKYDSLNNNLKIGDSDITFDGKNLKIGDREFKGSRGLYELLFKKNPKDSTPKDRADYARILKMTHALHRNNDPEQQIIGTRSKKYLKIIKPLLKTSEKKNISTPKSKTLRSKKEKLGFGIYDQSMYVDNKPYDYIYWDDVNELVDRLALLWASKRAGNVVAHNNEISSIEEELRELRYIA